VILLWLVAAWLIGIVLAAHATQPPAAWLVIAASGFIGLLITRKVARWRLLFACALTFGLGAARQASTRHTLTVSDLAYYNDRGAADLTGIIVDAPDVRDKTVHLRIQINMIRVGKTPLPIDGLLLVEADRFGSYAYGDIVTLFGQPQTPPTFDSFSYQDYLAQSGIYSFMLLPKITITAHGQGNPLLAAMFDFKARAHDLIGQLLPSPQSALLSGVLLGIRTDLPPDVLNAFNQTGTTRVLVIDGSKMTIIAGLLFVLFGRLRNKRLAALLIIMGLLFYTALVGGSPPVLRAATMAGLSIIAVRLGRQSDGLTALAFAVWLQTALDPLLITDAALLISASSTLGLIVFGEPLTHAVEHALNKLFAAKTVKVILGLLADTVLVSIAVQLPALPIMFLIFGQFSPIGLLVNILLTPAQAPILALGLLSVAAGAILFPVGQIIAWLAALPVSYTLALVRAAAQLPNASLAISATPLEAIGYYVILAGVALLIRMPAVRRKAWLTNARKGGTLRKWITLPTATAVGLGVAALLWAFALAHPDGRLHVWFLSVGAGNAVLIQTPNGAHILIDGGPNPTQLATAIGDRLPFYQRDLDVLIVTQPKISAVAALPPLLAHYTIHTVLTDGQTTNHPAYAALSGALAQAQAQTQTQLIAVTAGYRLQTSDGVTLQFVNPQQAPDPLTKPDDGALTVRLSYHDVSFLLTADLSDSAEQAMIKDGWYIGASVLQLSTHASDAANSDAFLRAVAPQIAVIEAEAGSRTNKPSDAVLKRIGAIPVYRTDEQGTLEFSSDGKTLWVSVSH